MNIIVDLCANTAAGYIAQGKFVEAIPNLRAAMYFGGNESARVNSTFLAHQFAVRAQEAFAKSDMEDAARNAGLSLAVERNETALIILAQIYLGKDHEAVADIARQLAEIAKDDDPRGLKINACLWRLDALQQIEPRDAALEQQIGREALAAMDRHIELQPNSPGGLMARAMLYRRFGNLDMALKDLRLLRQLDPTNLVVAAHCADLISDARDPQCLSDLTDAARLSAQDPAMTAQLYDLTRRCGAAAVAQGLLERLADLDPGYRFLLETKAALGTAPPRKALGDAGGRKHRVFLYAYEASTARSMMQVTAPMLLALGNLPALAAAGGVTVEMTAPIGQMDMIENAPILAKLAEVCAVELRFHQPTPTRFERRAFGLAFEAAAARAKAEGAGLISAPMHAVIADGSLKALADKAGAGAVAVFFDPLEVASAPLMGWVGGGASGERVVMKPSDLSEATLRHMPASSRRWIVDQEGMIESGARRLLFAKSNGLSVHSIQGLSIYLSAQALQEMGEDLSDPPDGFIIDRTLSINTIKIETIDIGENFAIAVMEDLAGATDRLHPRRAADVLIEQCRAAPSTLRRARLLSLPTHWSGLPPARSEPTPDTAEDAVIAEITKRLVGL